MGKKNKTPKEPQEKVITGSGADVVPHEDEQGRVKCKCIVPCVWRGYRDEGDTVWIEREMFEKDDFFRAHFKAVEGVVADGAEGGGSASRGGRDGTGEGEGDGGGSASRGGRDGTDEGGTAAEDGGNGQGELGLN